MKTNLPLLAAAGTTVLAFGLYLSLSRPFSEEKPSQIKNIECTEYQFSWYDAEIGLCYLNSLGVQAFSAFFFERNHRR